MTESSTEKTTWWHLHRRLYNWVIHFADTPHGERALFALSFAESSFFPVPPDVLLAPLALGAPKKWFRFATLCSIASMLGGVFGYCIGIFLWFLVGNFFHTYVPGFSRDTVTLKDNTQIQCIVDTDCVRTEGFLMNLKTTIQYPLVITLPGGEKRELSEQEVSDVQVKTFSIVGDQYRQYGWQIVAFAGFTPFPYKVITITSGIFKINFLVFVIASVLSRSARFYMVAGLFGWKGETVRPFIEKYFNWLSLLFFLLLIGGFAAIKLLHH
ncbi:MAG: DedA family protein [Planctomycetales bacterium]|nr:DedA family protein [Planctomycetales bacterium]